MAYTTTLLHAPSTEHLFAGRRAMDLAKVAQARYPVPLSFIIPCELYDTFLSESGIKGRLPGIYERHPQTIEGYAHAYREVLGLFGQVHFSSRLREELLEAYRSLAIPSSASGASALVDDDKPPSVMIIPSPTYRLPEEGLEGVQANVIGDEEFLSAIKNAWASSFLPERVLGRQHYGIAGFSTGLIVEQQAKAEATAMGTYHASSQLPLIIESYAGHLDIIGEVTKDEHKLSAEHLQIHERTIHDQPFRLMPARSGSLEQRAMGDEGRQQVINDRQVLEAARLTKRSHVIIGEDARVHCTIEGEHVKVLLVERLGNETLTRDVEASPDPVVAQEDEYVPYESVNLEEDQEAPAAEEEVSIVEEEPEPSQGEVEAYDEEPSGEEEAFIAAESYEETPTEEEPAEAQEAAAAEVEPYDEEPAAQEEETLFDMVQQEEAPRRPSPGAEFIKEVMEEARKRLAEIYEQRFEGEVPAHEGVVAALKDAGALPVDEGDLGSFASWYQRVHHGDEPTDAAIGLTWRVLQQLLR